MKKLLKEFEEFALKGSMLDLAVGVIIGGAFNGIITSLVADIVMPILSLFTGKIDFSNLFITLNGESYPTLKAAQDAGVSVISYGQFMTELLNFLIMAFVVFLFVRKLNSLRKKPAPAAPTEKSCPYCLTNIPVNASRCPNCTSILEDGANPAR